MNPYDGSGESNNTNIDAIHTTTNIQQQQRIPLSDNTSFIDMLYGYAPINKQSIANDNTTHTNAAIDHAMYTAPVWYRFSLLRHRYLSPFNYRFKCLPQLSLGHVLSILLYILIHMPLLIATLYIYLDTIVGHTDNEIHSSDSTTTRITIAHIIGTYGTMILSLSLLPIIRHNFFFSYVLNLSDQYLLQLHICLAYTSILFLSIHAVLATMNCYFEVQVGTDKSMSSEMKENGVIGLYIAGFTSYGSILCTAFLASASVRKYTYELFIYTHRLLFLVMLVFGVFHYIWVAYIIALPLLLYFIDIVMKFYNQFGLNKRVEIYHMSILGNDIVRIEFNIENFQYSSGQYVFICIPCIDPFEWHPFSLSSSPHMPTLTLHIRVQGDWTQKLFSHVKRLHLKYDDNNKETTVEYPKIYVDGAYGCANMPFSQYTHFKFISGGIGITPLQSMYNTLIHEWRMNRQELAHIEFVWTLRRRADGVDDETATSLANYTNSFHQNIDGVAISSKQTDEMVAPAIQQLTLTDLSDALEKHNIPIPDDHLDVAMHSLHSYKQGDAVNEYHDRNTICQLNACDPPLRKALPLLRTSFHLTNASEDSNTYTIDCNAPASTSDASSTAMGSHNVVVDGVSGMYSNCIIRYARPQLETIFHQYSNMTGQQTRILVLTCGPRNLINHVKALCCKHSNDDVKFDIHHTFFHL